VCRGEQKGAGISTLCEAYGYSRQGYYKRRGIEGKREAEEEAVVKQVQRIRKRQPRVGGRKLHKMLGADECRIGRDRLLRILRERGLLVKRKRKYVRTTQSAHWFKVYKNLIKEEEARKPEQVFVADITYLETMEGYCYLSLITDWYSRKIMGYAVSRSLSIEGSVRALKMALRRTKNPKLLIHHSDRGIQYCSKGYTDMLKEQGVRISMTEENHVYENALAERVNGILKDELQLGEKILSFRVAERMVQEAVQIYNEERLHMSLDYMTPAQKHAA
jgi:putative transposase